MIPPTPLHGLQDWYLRAADGEWQAAPGVPVDPRAAAHAWADLPIRATRAAAAAPSIVVPDRPSSPAHPRS